MQSSTGIGTAALASLFTSERTACGTDLPLASPTPHFAPKAKRIIYLFQSGGPSQIDLFDYKPKMAEIFDHDLPDSVRQGQRFTTMTSGQSRFPHRPERFPIQTARSIGIVAQ